MSGNLEDMRAYARGYEDGRRSKDADHAALALRLSRLRFDGGSHENLHKIAYAVYPCATGWTCESAKGLRDRLIDLLGGVHEHRCDSGRGCACGDSSAGGYGELAEAVTYDVLGNERHKAVCRLREWEPDEDGAPMRELWEAVTGEELPTVPLKGDAELYIIMRDRLIYLLGGDEKYFYVSVRDDGSIDRRADQSHESSPMSLENETGITDELRECVETATKTYEGSWYEMNDADHTICHITEGELTRIADRIDEQLNRICQQQEAVLQSTIDTMVDEREELQRELEYTKKSLDGMREQRERWADEAIEMFRVFFPHDEYCVPNSPSKMVIPKINEMQKKLDELEKFDHDTSLAAFGDDNDELRKLLSRAAKLLDNAEQDRDANYANWMDCKAKVVQANATIDELQAKLEEADAAIANWREREMSFDESEHERDELKATLDAIREAFDVSR